jgi:hypothetical protein
VVSFLSLFRSNSIRVQVGFTLACASLLVAGCRREEVREYRVPKEQAAAPEQTLPAGHPSVGGVMPGEMPPAPAPPKWTLPAGWTEKPPSAMRVASFSVTGKDGQTAEVGVIPLPSTGMEVELVNMWRQQLHLPGVSAAEADKQAGSIAVGVEQGKLFEIASEEPIIDGKSKARILVAMVTRGPTSWFFKMTGEDSFVQEQKPVFAEFLKSIVFDESPLVGGAGNPEPRTLSGLPADGAHPAVAGRPTVSEDAAGQGLPEWQPPSDWKAQPPGQMVLASFAVGDEQSGKATVSISAFPGDVGGLAANVNRWRRQIGLGEVAETDLDKLVTTLEVAGGSAKLVDMTGASARLVGAIVPHGGQTWFYKLMGDEKVVGQQKEAFTQFVQGVKY